MIEIATTHSDSRIYTSEFLTNYLSNAILLVWGSGQTLKFQYSSSDLVIGDNSMTISKLRVWGIK